MNPFRIGLLIENTVLFVKQMSFQTTGTLSTSLKCSSVVVNPYSVSPSAVVSTASHFSGELQFVVVDKCTKAMSLLSDSEISLKTIILVEEASQEVKDKAEERGIEVISFSATEELGKENKKDFVVCWTSL